MSTWVAGPNHAAGAEMSATLCIFDSSHSMIVQAECDPADICPGMQIMNNTRAVCFDLFSTLVSVGRVPEEVGPYTADILGVDADVWRAACFGDNHDICSVTNAVDNMRRMAHALDPHISEDTIHRAVEVRQRRFDHALLNIDAEIHETLRELKKRGLKLALVSNASTSEVLAWPHSPLAPLFDTVVFSCECGFRKPQPDIYHHALAQLEVEAGECLFVGDGGSDELFGAREAGLRPVWTTFYLSANQQARQRRKWGTQDWPCIASLREMLDWPLGEK